MVNRKLAYQICQRANRCAFVAGREKQSEGVSGTKRSITTNTRIASRAICVILGGKYEENLFTHHGDHSDARTCGLQWRIGGYRRK